MKKIHFYLRYHTNFGQNLFITGNIPSLGNNDSNLAVPMFYLNNEFCYAQIQVDEKQVESINYKYIFRDVDGTQTIESENDRIINLKKIKAAQIELVDVWNFAGEFENAFFTKPFKDTFFKQKDISVKQDGNKIITHVFKVKAPLIKQNETLCLIGNVAELGAWDTTKPTLMGKEENWFTAPFNFTATSFPIVYKYGVWDVTTSTFVKYEDGNNRVLMGDADKNRLRIMHDGFAYLPNNTFKAAGVAIPVFSLRSSNSFGVGEFADIKLLVDWAKSIGLKLIQLLPINDTTADKTWHDSYPYSAISAFALHPMFINLERVAGGKNDSIVQPLKEQQVALNALTVVDYEAVMNTKLATLRELYNAQKSEVLASEDYKTYYLENEHWLLPYAAFCYLRDLNNTANYNQWQTNQKYDLGSIKQMVLPSAESYDDIAFHLYIQYQLHLQLQEAVDYAHANGIAMKGDIPIGIYRNSCDAWVQPELYNMDAQSGAPPDDFAVNGQNWGFPTYNWDKMQQDGFSWWKQRFAQMGYYFDAFRIDHILGFFRIWSIPMNQVQGIMGKFVPCIPVYVQEFAEKGIWFNYDRYCKPFINDAVIGELFGDQYDWVKWNILDDRGYGNYELKEHLNTQKKVEAWFATQNGLEEWIKLKIYDLISNVILFEEPNSNGQQFHFRIEMEKTISYRNLDANTKWLLEELYVNYYFRRQDGFWKTKAMQKLPALKASTNMLICGEDLGMVPDCVPGVMKSLGLLSLEIQRMPKDISHQFFNPRNAPYLSVVTPSTHDMSTIRGWWEEDRETTQKFYNNELGQYGAAPYFCEPWVNKAIVAQHLNSPAMLSIFQLQDLMGIDGDIRRKIPDDERINIPADPNHYWRYRMHISLEDLMKIEKFNSTLKGMVKESGRA